MAKSPLLDFKKFQHVKSDDKTTTLRHKDGHLVKIFHKALGKDAQAQLKAMAEGGGVSENRAPAPSQTRDNNPPKGENHDIPSNVNGPSSLGDAVNRLKNAWAEGGKVKDHDEPQVTHVEMPKLRHHENKLDYNQLRKEKREMDIAELRKPIKPIKRRAYAEGGETSLMSTGQVRPIDQSLPCLNPNCKSYGRPHPNCRCWGFAEGGEVVHYCRRGSAHKPDCEYHQGVSEQGRDVRYGNKMLEHGDSEAYEMSRDMAKDEAKGRAEFERQIHPKMKGLAEGGRVMYAEAGEVEGQDEDAPNMEPIDTDSIYEQRPAPKQADVDKEEQAELEHELQDVEPDQQDMPPEQREMTDRQQTFGPEAGATMQTQPTPWPQDNLEQVGARVQQQQAAQQQNQPQEPDPLTGEGYRHNNATWEQDLLNNHITPKTYHDIMYKDKSLPGKLASVLGVILGGVGSGLTHQPNAALQMMDNMIARDIDAQQKSHDNAKTLWGQNYQHALNQAQARNYDVHSTATQEQAKKVATESAYMQMATVTLHGALEKIKRMPPGPLQQKAAEAFMMTVGQLKNKEALVGEMLDANYIRNNGSLPGQDAMQRPAAPGSVPVRPAPAAPGMQKPMPPQNKNAAGLTPQEQKAVATHIDPKLPPPLSPKDWFNKEKYENYVKQYKEATGQSKKEDPIPDTMPDAPGHGINMNAVNKAIMLANSTDPSAMGRNMLTKEEIPLASKELEEAEKAQNALKIIHDTWPELMKHAHGNDVGRFMDIVGESHPWNVQFPDMTAYSEEARKFKTALHKILPAMQMLSPNTNTEGAALRLRDEVPVGGTESNEEMLNKLKGFYERVNTSHPLPTLKRRGLTKGWAVPKKK